MHKWCDSALAAQHSDTLCGKYFTVNVRSVSYVVSSRCPNSVRNSGSASSSWRQASRSASTPAVAVAAHAVTSYGYTQSKVECHCYGVDDEMLSVQSV